MYRNSVGKNQQWKPLIHIIYFLLLFYSSLGRQKNQNPRAHNTDEFSSSAHTHAHTMTRWFLRWILLFRSLSTFVSFRFIQILFYSRFYFDCFCLSSKLVFVNSFTQLFSGFFLLSVLLMFVCLFDAVPAAVVVSFFAYLFIYSKLICKQTNQRIIIKSYV